MKNKLNDQRISTTEIEKNKKKQEFLNIINSMIKGVKK